MFLIWLLGSFALQSDRKTNLVGRISVVPEVPWSTVAEILTVLGTIGGTIKYGRRIWTWVLSKLTSANQRAQKKTLKVIVEQGPMATWWKMGSNLGTDGKAKPFMMIVEDCFFTNLSEEPNIITQTFLTIRYRKWKFIPLINGPRDMSS